MQRKILGFHDESESHGGTTRYLRAILAGLDRERYEPVLFATAERGWHRDLQSLGVKVVTLCGAPSRTVSSPTPAEATDSAAARLRLSPRSLLRCVPGAAWTLGQIRELRTLGRLFARHPVDLLHTNQAGLEVASVAARLARVPVVVGTWHVDPSYDLTGARRGLRYRLVEAASLRAFHHSISVSEDTRRQWMERCWLGRGFLDRVTVIHNGIEVERFRRAEARSDARRRLDIPPQEVLLGSLGRLEPAKGYEFLIRALPLLKKGEVPFTLLIAGRGPQEAELRRLARDLDVERHVRFVGFVSDVRAFLEPLDIYVQPSLCESLGLGILEAGAVGLPVVASRIGGIPETVLDGVTGFLVSPRDPEAIAAGLGSLMADAARRDEMGQRAQERVSQHFTSEAMGEKTVALYERLLGESR